MIKYLLVFMGFVSAFSIDAIVPLPMIISFFMMINLLIDIINRRAIKKITYKITIPLFIFFIVLIISYYKQAIIIGFNRTAFNHLLSYAGTIIMYLVVPLLSFKHFDFKIEKIFKYISIGLIIVSIFTIVEFLTKNFTQISFDQFIYRPLVRDYAPTYRIAGDRFIRARGVAVESGHLAMYISMFLPFLYYYYKYIEINQKKLVLTMLLVVTALFLTFSAAALFENSLTILLLFLLFSFKKINKGLTRHGIIFGFIVLIILFIFGYILVNTQIFGGMLAKISLSGTSSGDDRISRWINALKLFRLNPLLGAGPGITSIIYGTGSTNFYLELLTQVGILGITPLLFMMFTIFSLIFNIDYNIKYVFLYSLTISLIHYALISDYWYPWIWLLIAIVLHFYEQSDTIVETL